MIRRYGASHSANDVCEDIFRKARRTVGNLFIVDDENCSMTRIWVKAASLSVVKR